jgi:hypothetical protein
VLDEIRSSALAVETRYQQETCDEERIESVHFDSDRIQKGS